MDLRRRTCLILASLLTISFISGAVCGVGESVGEKVKLELYYETLCPYCSRFIVKYLIDVFESGVISIVDLNLVPYGNAKIGPNATITCQHGPSECLLNTIEACAIYVWPDVNAHFPFIYCVENLVYEGKYPEWEMCFEKLGLDPKPVTDCYINGKGNQLELQYAVETNSLEPRHTYVPWVVVDGKPLYDDYENVISYICKVYRGTDVPHACSEQLFTIIHKEKMNFIYPGCYSKDTTKSTVSRTRSGITSWIRPFKAMDRYQKVEEPKPKLPINENEIRITSQGLSRNYISYATNILQVRTKKIETILHMDCSDGVMVCFDLDRGLKLIDFILWILF